MADRTTETARAHAGRVKSGPLTQDERASHKHLVNHATALCRAIDTSGMEMSSLARGMDNGESPVADELTDRLLELRRFVRQMAVPMALVAKATPEEPPTILEED